jgi:glutamyl-tRNA reductase
VTFGPAALIKIDRVVRLAVLHYSPPLSTPPADPAAWRTCLRDVVFVDAEAGDLDAHAISDADAYRLVLEILCGLESPMLGETQVLGQFKTFLSSLPDDHAWIQRIGQRLLADAARVREQHLRHLGSRSYGSAVRRYVGPGVRAVVVGAGQLAQEIVPFLATDSRTVDQWQRATPAAASPIAGVTVRMLDDLAGATRVSEPAVLIVAAPVPRDTIARVASRYADLTRVLDLRADRDGEAAVAGVPVTTLEDLFSDMTAARTRTAAQVDAARQDIARRSRQFGLRDDLRPFGWDDLCA